MQTNIWTWVVFVAAALLEVGGDAVVRRGLRGRHAGTVLAGCASLCCYGLLVNSVKWDFSKLIGVYIGFFALVSALCGRIFFQENVPPSTWMGLAVIIAGCGLIQFGHR